MNTLVAIDPGRRTGWALFMKHQLDSAGYVEPYFKNSNRVNQICKIVSAPLVLIEQPRWYPHEHKIDVNDLLDLSVLVGEIKHSHEAIGNQVELVWPRTWKGSVPKEIFSQRILDALSVEEAAKLPRRPRADRERKDAGAYDNNMLDACGLALWKLGRLT